VKKPAIAIALVVVLAIAGVIFYAGQLAKMAIETGVETAMGVEADVGFVYLGLASGQFRMRGLKIGNPPGFEADHFVSLASIRTSVSYGALREGRVEISELVLSGLDVQLEWQGTKGNYSVILENMGSAESSSAAEEESSVEFVIRELLIQDVTASARVSPSLGELGKADVEIPEIRLSNVGAGSPGGVDLAELSEIIVGAVLKAVADKSGDLPGQMRASLRRGVDRLPKIPGGWGEVVDGQAGRLLGGKEEGSGKIPDLSEDAGKLLKGLGSLGGGKD
jgi:hypothetical protein